MKQERDRLTGLYNKEKAVELIQHYISNTQEECVAVVLDVDNFQKVNNLFGVEEGDRILQDVANTLREFFNEKDIISRTHGDQFIILAKNCPDDANLNLRLHELCTTMEQELGGEDNPCRISASIGVATTKTLGHSFDALYHGASVAMDEVKKNGKGSVGFYRPKSK